MAVAIAARQKIRGLREQLKSDHITALGQLDEIFESGEVPDPPLDGEYNGQIITTMFTPFLDSLAQFMMSIWMPWRGKSFDIECGIGDNLLTRNGARAMGALFWQRISPSDFSDRYLTFGFKTSFGPSVINSDQDVLKIDYDVEENPRRFVRSMVDELVEIGDGYYLGRSLLRRSPSRILCWAYFTLSEVYEPSLAVAQYL